MKMVLLQVGINATPGAPLYGCLNDLANFNAALAARNIETVAKVTIADAEATRANMLSGLDWLVRHPHPCKIFQYSGHGARLRSASGRERELYDSAIVPFDYANAGLLLDDELAIYYDRVPKNHQLTILSDSCHSGRSQRAFVTKLKTTIFHASTPRVLPAHLMPPDLVRLTLHNTPRLFRMPGRPRKSFTANNERCILIAACKAEQTAADAYIGSQYQGAGTASLLWAWKNNDPLATSGEVAADANLWLKKNRFDQVLRVEAKREVADHQFLFWPLAA